MFSLRASLLLDGREDYPIAEVFQHLSGLVRSIFALGHLAGFSSRQVYSWRILVGSSASDLASNFSAVRM
jgi:hypothetical protein